jgi:AcrR family transcriptional regulator
MIAAQVSPVTSRSRERLLDAVVDLVRERGATHISVTDVVDRASVTRPTFYNTFADLTTAYEEAARRRLERAFLFESPADSGREMLESITRILDVLHADLPFFSEVLRGPASYRVTAIVIDVLSSRIRTESPISVSLASGPLPLEQTSRALAAGITNWIVQALASGRLVGQLAVDVRDFIVRSVDGGLGRSVDQ